MKRIVAFAVIVASVLAYSPTAALALQYSILGYYNDASWSGCRSANKVPSSITFGASGSGYDAAVNSVYVQKDAYNGVEYGWTWERYANGTISGPKMFGSEKYNGVIFEYPNLGSLTKGSTYTWFVKRSGVWIGGYGSTSKVIYQSTFLYGTPVTGFERQLSGCRVATNFSSMNRMNSGGTWSAWPAITFQDYDPYYKPTGNASAWSTVAQ